MVKTLYDNKEAIKVGMLTPSSNTSLEPICSNMVSGLEDKITMHYSRLTVQTISLDEEDHSQFDIKPFLDAAELLADVDVIAWNGTSGSWLGLDFDRELCRKITEKTGIPATSSMLAMLDAFERCKIESLHIMTPYIESVEELIKKQLNELGYELVNTKRLNQRVNRSFGLVTSNQINQMAKEVSQDKADGTAIICTNLKSAWQIEQLEKNYEIPVFDSTALTVWKTLIMAEIDPKIIKGWGTLFQNPNMGLKSHDN